MSAGTKSLDAERTVQTLTAAARAAQQTWSLKTTQQRLRIIRKLRHEIASGAEAIAATVPLEQQGSLHRSLADTLVAEVLPLLEACRFLEREGDFLLAPRLESNTARPVWLSRVAVETRREPLGVVLVIAPGNYPLFLPGVQALQALVAGNAVLWKPAPGGAAPAIALQRMLVACGLDPDLLIILDTSVEAGRAAICAGVDKVVLTGSAATGRAVLHDLAETLTPSVMELSGCDAVFVLEGADLARAAEAIAFALRLNGSATCMAPRRLFVSSAVAKAFAASLVTLLGQIEPVPVPEQTRALLRDLIDEATLYGAELLLNGLDAVPEGAGRVQATLLTHLTAEMRIVQADIFAPVLSIMRVDDDRASLLAAYDACPYALSAAIFGPERQAEALAGELNAGTVLINDILVSTADPRATFGGRKASGFGTTRGREGLLAMTTAKTILRQSSRSRRAFQPTTEAHIPFFAAFAQMLHGHSWFIRFSAARRLLKAARQIK